MHHITTKKAPGVIAGTQTSDNGPIEWSRQLPPHCQLKAGLKFLVTPLLAGLLEENQQRMWSFDRFFFEVTHILSKRLLHVFYINKASSIEIYLEPNESLFNVKEHIQVQTEVPASSQLLLWDDQPIEIKVGIESSVRGYSKTEEENPIFLFNIDNNNVGLPNELELPRFPSFSQSVSVEHDASQAKVGCSVGHECKRRVESFTSIDILMGKGIQQIIGMLKTTLHKLLE